MRHASTTFVGLLALVIMTVTAIATIPAALSGGYTVTIAGGSMDPTIPRWSLALVEPATRYQIGDIVTFATTGRPVTHRIVDDWSGNADLWLTRGDANPQPDPVPVPSDAILGRVAWYLPGLGLTRDLLASPIILAFLALLGATIMYWPRTKPRPPETQLAIAEHTRRGAA